MTSTSKRLLVNCRLVNEDEIKEVDVLIEGDRIDRNWVEKLVIGAKACLELKAPPAPGEDCDYCAYSSTRSAFWESG